ncbi:DNA-binding response regulator [Streptococcus sp. zg-JUN1979]|uniref:DNA-binding response regulator n=1 Tax=Streptococcus sp. zg-JUN1979 TaxID=3391450 RepID=UPI0039A5408E
MTSRIFIVEDDVTILNLLKQHLKQSYEVGSVCNFRDVAREVEAFEADLVLMDITLPYYNGFYWTTQLRQRLSVPIIFISSSDDEMDMVMALNMGGDDFISKPFSLPILEAKINAFLRRAQQFSRDDNYQLDEFSLSRDGVLTNANKQEVTLSPTELKILVVLFERVNQLVLKEDLLERLWENESFIDANTLNVNMTRLRKKVAQIGFTRIHTVRGAGYILK